MNTVTRIAFILFVVFAFTSIGWITPALYASYAPNSHFVNVHEFSVQNATVGDRTTNICYTRYIREPQTGTVHAEIVLVNGDNVRQEVYRWQRTEYFQQGTSTVQTTFPLSPTMDTGKYRYRVTTTFELANGRVTRTFTAISEPFYIKETPTSGNNFICE